MELFVLEYHPLAETADGFQVVGLASPTIMLSLEELLQKSIPELRKRFLELGRPVPKGFVEVLEDRCAAGRTTTGQANPQPQAEQPRRRSAPALTASL